MNKIFGFTFKNLIVRRHAIKDSRKPIVLEIMKTEAYTIKQTQKIIDKLQIVVNIAKGTK